MDNNSTNDVSIEYHNESNRDRPRRPRILFAVTGSVAAVKGPEIAVRLVTECDYDVRVLLTRGGENFWNKAKDYNPKYWDLLQKLLDVHKKHISVVCKSAI